VTPSDKTLTKSDPCTMPAMEPAELEQIEDGVGTVSADGYRFQVITGSSESIIEIGGIETELMQKVSR